MNKQLCAFCTILILLTTSPGNAQPASASAQFLVSQGAANYEIQLAVPPGTRGVDPALTVEYSSMGGEGLIGTGFDIGGFSTIVRCPATLLQDGFSGAVSYDANDRFCIEASAVSDGRLIPNGTTSGAYYAPNQPIIYHTEVESFRKVVPSQNACGSGPCSFDVWLKDGSHLQYNAVTLAVDSGNSIPVGSIRTWQLSSVADLHGNTYTISYNQTPSDTLGNPIPDTANAGVSYPTRIDYTSGPGGLVAQRSVQFYYQASSNAVFQYQGGAMVKRAARLAEIQTCINANGIANQSCSASTLVNRYVFSYASNVPTGRNRLSSFGECDGNGNCLTPIQFNWSADATTLTSSPATGVSAQTSSSYVGDFDGNGLTDLLSVAPGHDQLLLRQPNAFNTISNTGLNLNGVTATWIADFNGDGLSDVYAHGVGDELFLSTGNFSSLGQGFSSTPITNLKFLTYTFVADVNGDGMTDFFTSTATTGLFYLSTGNGFVAQTAITGLQIVSDSTTWLADFNGDNMADLLTEKNGSTAYLSLSTGTGFTSSINPLPLNLSGAFTYVADFNGDGLNDVLSADGSNGTLSVGTGSGFIANTLS
ncbi:MAG: FG-GAP repeat domain-containing protein, partial [Arenimonas sp.]